MSVSDVQPRCLFLLFHTVVVKATARSCNAIFLSHLQSAEDGGHPAVQDVPAPVAFADHRFELAGSVGAVLSGQAAVLIVDQFQLGQPLVYLPLEALKG